MEIHRFAVILTILILGSLLSTGCTKNTYENQYPELMATKSGAYSILYIDNLSEDQTTIQTPEVLLMIKEPNRGMYFPSIDKAKEQYPNLNIKETPIILVFDEKSLVLETNDENKVKALL